MFFFDGLNSMSISRTNLHKNCESNQHNVDCNNTSKMNTTNARTSSQINFQI